MDKYKKLKTIFISLLIIWFLGGIFLLSIILLTNNPISNTLLTVYAIIGLPFLAWTRLSLFTKIKMFPSSDKRKLSKYDLNLEPYAPVIVIVLSIVILIFAYHGELVGTRIITPSHPDFQFYQNLIYLLGGILLLFGLYGLIKKKK